MCIGGFSMAGWIDEGDGYDRITVGKAEKEEIILMVNV